MKRALQILLPIGILGLATGITALMILNRKEPPRRQFQAPPREVVARTLEPQSYQIVLESQGSVQARTTSNLIPEVRGRIVAIGENFQEGAFFEEGEILIEIEKADYEAELIVAEANYAQAELRLAEEEAQAQAHFDEQYGALQDQLDTAQDQLNAILGIDDRVLTLAELFELFNANLEALSTFLEESLAEEEETPDNGPTEPPFTWEPVIQLPPIEIEWPKDPITIPIVPDPIEVDGLVTALDNLRASVQLLEAATITATTVTSGGDVSTGGGVAVSPSDANFNNNEVLTAIALNTAKTAKLLGRWDGDGQPETRSVI